MDVEVLHLLFQDLQALFALTATDDLTDFRHQQIHGCNCTTIVIIPHVEGLDSFRVVGHKKRPINDFLCQVTLML